MDAEEIERINNQSLSRKIRLKKLLDEAHEIDKNMANQSADETLSAVNRIITASNDIISEGNVQDRAEHTTEVVMDAHVLKMNHELVSKVLLQTEDYSHQLMTSALSAIVFKDESEQWGAIAERVACTVARTVDPQPSMLGAVNVTPKERVVKERQQRKRATLTQEKRPETIDTLKRQDRGAQKVNMVHEKVAQIFKANNRQPIPYFKLIIDPNSFMNSVQNAFQMAFLARDNMIAIETGHENLPYVRLVTSNERKDDKETSQSVCSLNTKKWEEMKKHYKITEAMLEARYDDVDDE